MNLVYIENCGDYDRTIFALPPEDKVIIGCFEGTFEEAEEAIREKYEGEALNAYLEKLKQLKAKWAANEPFDPEKYNWENDSWAIAQYCPEKLDPEKYNWEADSWAVAQYCPEHFDPEKYNWKDDSRYVAEYCPEKLDPEKYNWKDASWAVKQYCPEKLKLKKEKWNE